MTFPRRALLGLTVLAIAAPGCGLVLGLDDFSEQAATTSTSTGAGGGTSASTSSSTSDASSTTSTGTGTGGAPPACTPATVAVCDDKNACTDDTCDPNGTCVLTATKIGSACGDAAAYTCDGKGTCLDGQTTWAKGYGDGLGEQAGQGIAADKDGNVLVTGYYKGTLDFDGTPITSTAHDAAFIAKLDPTGKGLWSKSLPSKTDTFGRAIAADSQGNVVFGGSAADSSLTVFDPKGKVLWQANFMPLNMLSSYSVDAVAVTKTDEIVAAGRFNGGIDFGKGNVTSQNNDVFLAKLTSTGKLVWVQTFSSAMSGFAAASVAVDSTGNIVMGGALTGAVKLDGMFVSTSKGAKDAFIIKVDPTGKNIWTDVFGDAAAQEVEGVAFDPTGQVLLTGTFAGTIDLGLGGMRTSAGGNDAFVMKLSAAEGKVLWANTFGDPGGQKAHAVAVDPIGNVVVSGEFVGTVDFGGGPVVGPPPANTFIAKYNGVGKYLWAHAYVDAIANAVAADPSANVLLTGTFVGATDFGLGVINTVGQLNVFVAKLAP